MQNWTLETLIDLARRLAQDVVGEPVAADDNFFDAGFTSQSLVCYADLLSAELDRPVKPLTLFSFPNVRRLATHLHVDEMRGPS